MKTIIKIEIETDHIKEFFGDDREIISKEVEKELHEVIFAKLEDCLQNEDFESDCLEDWREGDYEYYPAKFKKFLDIGTLMIRIIQDEVQE